MRAHARLVGWAVGFAALLVVGAIAGASSWASPTPAAGAATAAPSPPATAELPARDTETSIGTWAADLDAWLADPNGSGLATAADVQPSWHLPSWQHALVLLGLGALVTASCVGAGLAATATVVTVGAATALAYGAGLVCVGSAIAFGAAFTLYVINGPAHTCATCSTSEADSANNLLSLLLGQWASYGVDPAFTADQDILNLYNLSLTYFAAQAANAALLQLSASSFDAQADLAASGVSNELGSLAPYLSAEYAAFLGYLLDSTQDQFGYSNAGDYACNVGLNTTIFAQLTGHQVANTVFPAFAEYGTHGQTPVCPESFSGSFSPWAGSLTATVATALPVCGSSVATSLETLNPDVRNPNDGTLYFLNATHTIFYSGADEGDHLWLNLTPYQFTPTEIAGNNSAWVELDGAHNSSFNVTTGPEYPDHAPKLGTGWYSVCAANYAVSGHVAHVALMPTLGWPAANVSIDGGWGWGSAEAYPGCASEGNPVYAPSQYLSRYVFTSCDMNVSIAPDGASTGTPGSADAAVAQTLILQTAATDSELDGITTSLRSGGVYYELDCQTEEGCESFEANVWGGAIFSSGGEGQTLTNMATYWAASIETDAANEAEAYWTYLHDEHIDSLSELPSTCYVPPPSSALPPELPLSEVNGLNYTSILTLYEGVLNSIAYASGAGSLSYANCVEGTPASGGLGPGINNNPNGSWTATGPCQVGENPDECASGTNATNVWDLTTIGLGYATTGQIGSQPGCEHDYVFANPATWSDCQDSFYEGLFYVVPYSGATGATVDGITQFSSWQDMAIWDQPLMDGSPSGQLFVSDDGPTTCLTVSPALTGPGCNLTNTVAFLYPLTGNVSGAPTCPAHPAAVCLNSSLYPVPTEHLDGDTAGTEAFSMALTACLTANGLAKNDSPTFRIDKTSGAWCPFSNVTLTDSPWHTVCVEGNTITVAANCGRIGGILPPPATSDCSFLSGIANALAGALGNIPIVGPYLAPLACLIVAAIFVVVAVLVLIAIFREV